MDDQPIDTAQTAHARSGIFIRRRRVRDRLSGALAYLGYEISEQTVGNILRKAA
jgi:hypothetical protein